MALEAELAYFNEHRAELLAQHAGKFVVIQDSGLVGAFDSSEAAYEYGVSRFGLTPFLIKQVLEVDPTAHAPALYTGLTRTGV